MEKTDIYNMRVIPLVKRITTMEKGKKKTTIIDNLSRDEIRNMSCEPRMLHRNNEGTFFMELPPTYHDTRIKWTLFYLYDELNDLEKERFASRTITIPVTVDSVIKLYTNKVRKKKK